MFVSENISTPILEKCFAFLLDYLPDGRGTLIDLAGDIDLVTELAKMVGILVS
jgi:hypothetical protein